MAVKSPLRRIIRLECLGFSLILIFFIIFDFYPNLKAVGQLKKKIRLARETSETVSQPEWKREMRKLEEKLDQKKVDLQFIQQAITEFQSKIVQEKNIPLITEEIVNIAASSQIELDSVKPLSSQVRDEYELLPIEIRFQCGYAALIDFLSKAEASSTLVAVQDLSINRDEAILPKLDICLTACALFASERAK